MQHVLNTNNDQYAAIQKRLSDFGDTHLATLPPGGKKSFLVFKQNKYMTIPTNTIAFFYIKFNAPVIVCFDRQEYCINYSLEQLEHLLPPLQFFRINRQYLVNFN